MLWGFVDVLGLNSRLMNGIERLGWFGLVVDLELGNGVLPCQLVCRSDHLPLDRGSVAATVPTNHAPSQPTGFDDATRVFSLPSLPVLREYE